MTTPGTNSFVRRSLLSFLFQLVLPLIFCPLYLIVLIVLMPLCLLYRLCVRLAAKILRPDLDGITDVMSQGFLSNKTRWSGNKFNIINGYVVKGRLNAEAMAKIVETQVLPLKEYKALKAYPVRFGGYFHWKPDLAFNVQNHVKPYDGGGVSGASRVSDADLKRIMGARLGHPWEENQSLWELLVINNYFPRNDAEEDEEEKSVLLLRLHHFLGDGYSVNELFERLCTGDRTIAAASSYKGRTWTRMTAELLAGPYFLCRWINVLQKRASEFFITKDARGDGCDFFLTWTEGISVKNVSEVRKKFGVSFQAVLNAVVSGALHKLLKELGHEPPGNLIVSQPRFLPGHPGGLSNHFAGGAVNLPLGERDPARRVQLCQETLVEVFEAVSSECIDFLTKLCLYWSPVAEFFQPPKDIKRAPLEIIVVACPGPRGPVFIDGKELERWTPSTGTLNPLGDAIIGMYTALGKLIITVAARKHFCSDPEVLERFHDFLLEEMQELLDAKPLHTTTVIEA